MKFKPRRVFSREFKVLAVQESLDSSESLVVVAAKLGVTAKLLSRWRSELTKRAETDPAPVENRGPDKSTEALERENRKLKKRLERAELENEILKKANEHFAKLQK
jgi:Transposase.